MDSSATKKSNSDQLHDAAKNDDINLPTTLTELPKKQQQQDERRSESVQDERKAIPEKLVGAPETPTESLELGCNDEGLIVIQTADVQQKNDDASRTVNEEKHTVRSK